MVTDVNGSPFSLSLIMFYQASGEEYFLPFECWLEIPENIKLSTKLMTLDSQGRKSLKSSPASLGQLSELQQLNVNGCDNLENIPEEMVHLTSNLNTISMWKCSNTAQLPVDFGNLKELGLFSAGGTANLSSLPDSFLESSHLEHLGLHGCKSLTQIP